MRTAMRVTRVWRDEELLTIIDKFDGDTFSLLGWLEYQLRFGKDTSLPVLNETFDRALQVYNTRLQLTLPPDVALQVTHETDQRLLYHVLCSFI